MDAKLVATGAGASARRHSQMTNESFRLELTVAQAMSRLGRPRYWQAFERGLHRAFHGEAAVSESEHSAWLSMKLTADTDGADRYQGYCDGLDV
jgi:hypothetical protein